MASVLEREVDQIALQPFLTRAQKQFGENSPDLGSLKPVLLPKKSVPAGTSLQTEGSEELNAYIVASGWLMTVFITADGDRSISRLYLPGDLIGWEDLNWVYATATVEAASDAVVVGFPKKEIVEIFRNATDLAYLFHRYAMIDYIWATDQHRVNGRYLSDARMAYFFLQVYSRLSLSSDEIDNSFSCPLTHQDIADYIGLSMMTINRSLKVLRDQRIIAGGGDAYTILDFDHMAKMCDFVDRNQVELWYRTQ